MFILLSSSTRWHDRADLNKSGGVTLTDLGLLLNLLLGR